MRKSLSLFMLFLMVLSGCQGLETRTAIDWVDFIKWDGKEYDGIYSGVIADEKYIGEKLGEVKFKVADNVSDPEYKLKNGDAAFHEKGTEIFTVKGLPNLIAVKSSEEINGYHLYYSREDAKDNYQFHNMPVEKVNRVEFYKANTEIGAKRLTELKSTEEINRLLLILKNSKESVNFQPDTSTGDPVNYQMVLYTGDPVAYKFDFHFDGKTYFWYPSEPAILPNEIQAFIPIK